MAAELRKRGYVDATSAQTLRIKGTKDAPLLELLAEMDQPAVLLTYDNRLPAERCELILKGAVAVAVIHKERRPDDLTLTQYFHETAHRHAHRFIEQELGTAFRYSAGPRRIRINLEELAKQAAEE